MRKLLALLPAAMLLSGCLSLNMHAAVLPGVGVSIGTNGEDVRVGGSINTGNVSVRVDND